MLFNHDNHNNYNYNDSVTTNSNSNQSSTTVTSRDKYDNYYSTFILRHLFISQDVTARYIDLVTNFPSHAPLLSRKRVSESLRREVKKIETLSRSLCHTHIPSLTLFNSLTH